MRLHRELRVDEAGVERADLFSNPFSAMVNAIIGVVIHVRGRDENVEFI